MRATRHDKGGMSHFMGGMSVSLLSWQRRGPGSPVCCLPNAVFLLLELEQLFEDLLLPAPPPAPATDPDTDTEMSAPPPSDDAPLPLDLRPLPLSQRFIESCSRPLLDLHQDLQACVSQARARASGALGGSGGGSGNGATPAKRKVRPSVVSPPPAIAPIAAPSTASASSGPVRPTPL
jgi:hypothetical protein